MKTIIIDGRRELAELPEKWYTDGTKEANEWGEKVYNSNHKWDYKYIGNDKIDPSSGNNTYGIYEERGHTYITPSEFLRLVYQPWKERVKLPTTYEEVVDRLYSDRILTCHHIPHIDACIGLTNIMNFANDAFKGDGRTWHIAGNNHIENTGWYYNPIRFTSKAAAEWAYKTFPEIFKAYWNV